MNMVALAQLLRELARIMTAHAMLAVYAVSQVGAGLAQGVLAPHGPVMVGASGAIFGLAGALLAWCLAPLALAMTLFARRNL